MNSTNSDFDIYSTFTYGATYDKAKKYFESLNCKSDKDCPESSSCIGNKCITPFYCKKDKSKCSFFKNICDGKPCYKPDNKCHKDEDCLSDLCEEKKCSYTNLINEYSFFSFTYEDAKIYYEKLNITCSNDDNCPNHTYCYDDYYPFEHHSFNKDCSNDENCFSHCISHFYCKKDKSVCSFIKDDENEIRFSSKISASDNIFGLENREECKFDKECIAGHCGCGMNLIGHGSCREPSDSDGMCGLPIVMVLGPLFLIECILILFIILSLIEKFRLKRKGLIKVKRSSFKCSLKCLTIAAIVIGVIFISFFIYLGILAHINSQPL